MNFRRIMTAMVLLACCVGLASAQVISGPVGSSSAGAMQCVATAAVPPTLRSEGMTELIGDIVLTCTGGNLPTVGTVVPTTNITVSLGTNVTSRLLPGSGLYATNTSEALLFIDEPTTNASGAAGVGPAAPLNYCLNTIVGAGTGGCVQTVAYPAGGLTSTSAASTATTTLAANVFQGVVTANQVTFNGVPVLPPVTSGVSRVFRITNVRANINAIGSGSFAGTVPLVASISTTSLPVNQSVLTTGLIQAGLNNSSGSILRNVGNTGGGGNTALAQCGGGGPSPLNLVRFTENFPSAFKTRVQPLSAATNAGQVTNATGQGTPGTIYQSESGLILTTSASATVPAGLADYGTRLKATFTNVPAGVRLFVSTANVTNDYLNPITAPASGLSTTSYAVLVLNESSPDSNGFPPAASFTATFSGFSSTTINIAEIPVVSGTAVAVWEIVNTNPNSLDVLDFGVYQQFTASPATNSPPVGTANVSLTFAPTPTVPFSATAGGAASSSLTVPRFADTSSGGGAAILNITQCQTVLLYPYVTNIAGFDTGLAIANTTTDPFGTRNQAGTCDMYFYGDAQPSAKVTTPSIASGKIYATLASTAAPAINGYMIAVCNFQLAHGFAFVSDLGARNVAMGYLALVLPNGFSSRNNTTESLNN